MLANVAFDIRAGDCGAAPARYADVFMEAIRWDNATKLFEQYNRES